MNKDKISAQDIIDALAAKADITKLLAEEFFKVLIATIEEALQANDSVKIKDLGTFKLHWIAPRKSVNVQTGEDIVIEGYYKVVFTPDKDLKELVNKPFAHLESVVLDDEENNKKSQEEANPLSSLTEQAGEIKGLLSEINSMSPQKEKNMEKETPKKKEEKRINASDLVIEKKEKKRIWLWVLLIVLLLLLTSVICYFACMPVQHWVNKNFFGCDTAVCDTAKEKSNLAEDWFGTSQEEVVVIDEFQIAFDNRFNDMEYAVVEKLRHGSRLAYLAEKYYGSPYFWVYIYEANADHISDPDNVLEGTSVRIPKMDPLLVDANSQRALDAAWELRGKYLK